MGPRLEKLDILNSKLKPPKELGGVFLPIESKKQFDFMFVAEMPSKNVPKDWDGKSNYNFNVTKRDKFLQKMMVRHNVDGSYITDIVKKVNPPRKPKKDEAQKWLNFLLEEIKIVQPKNIVVLGERTYRESFKPFVHPFIPENTTVDWVYHYSQQGAKTDVEVEQKFTEVINKLRQKSS